MPERIFGTDGIRGKAYEGWLELDNVELIAGAAATELAEQGDIIGIGYDPRESSEHIARAAALGVMASGVNVEWYGVVPTPTLADLASNRRAGIMISASHNKFKDNGIKLFGEAGRKIPDELELKIEERIRSGDRNMGLGGEFYDGRRRVSQYLRSIVSTIDGRFDGIRVIADLANGAAYTLGENVLSVLGAEVYPIFNRPDGRNINAGCGATDTHVLEQMLRNGAGDIGVAYDGDVDRAIFVDRLGRRVDGDHIIHVNAVMRGEKHAVATKYSNGGLGLILAAHDVDLHYTDKPGDRPVLEKMIQNGYGIGGEQSGHIIYNDVSIYGNRAPTGDGILTVLQTIHNLNKSGRTLDWWFDQMLILPQSLIKVDVPKTVLRHPDVIAKLKEREENLAGVGRLYVRGSGTEGGVRIMVELGEGSTLQDAEAEAEDIAASMRRAA